MSRITWLLAALLVIGVLAIAGPASAQGTATPQQPAAAGEYPNVSGVEAFTAAANYMSLPGYLRWMTFKEQGLWLTYAEALRIVQSQRGGLA